MFLQIPFLYHFNMSFKYLFVTYSSKVQPILQIPFCFSSKVQPVPRNTFLEPLLNQAVGRTLSSFLERRRNQNFLHSAILGRCPRCPTLWPPATSKSTSLSTSTFFFQRLFHEISAENQLRLIYGEILFWDNMIIEYKHKINLQQYRIQVQKCLNVVMF